MSDLLILFAADKKAFAARLADAARAAGYAAVPREIGDSDRPALPEEVRSAPAALLVWSRPLVASAAAEGWLGSLRALPNLVEVSADGIAPDTADEGRVILLSGWRGQPYHLGWQRILDRLRTACGHRRTAPVAPVPGAGLARSTGRRKAVVPALAGVALLAAIAGALSLPGGRQPPSPSPAPAAAAAAPAPAPSPAPAPAPAPQASAPALPAVRQPAAPPSPAAAPVPAARPHRPAARHAAAAGPIKRYSARNSKTMRLFCARSGRRTPQCAVFLRSMAAH